MNTVPLRQLNTPETFEINDELTEGEREYDQSQGRKATKFLKENQVAADDKGNIVNTTADGHVLKVGDVVRLCSGGPYLTIEAPRANWGRWLVCHYFKGDELTRLEIDPRMLVWVEHPRLAPPDKGTPAPKKPTKAKSREPANKAD